MPALIPPGHLVAGMAQLFLDIAFIHFGAAGQTGAQSVAGTELDAFHIRQIEAQPRIRHASLDQSRDVLVVETRVARALSVACDAGENGSKPVRLGLHSIAQGSLLQAFALTVGKHPPRIASVKC